MHEFHTPGTWNLIESTEDYQGHCITSNGRTIAATMTEDACEITNEDVANASLIVTGPAMLKALRQIARYADLRQEDGALKLGQRLIEIERHAKAVITLYEAPLAIWSSAEEDADE